jgi:outer membrane lipoprotein carrier protein
MQGIIKQLAVVTVGSLFSASLWAASAAQVLTQQLGKYHSLSADFVQYLLDASGSRLQETTGSMLLSQPNRFYWQTQDPFAQTIVSNGESVWIFDPDLEQVTLQLLDTRTTATPALLLSGDNQAIGEQFNVRMKDNNDGLQQFELQPKDPDNLYSSIRLYFLHGDLQQMQIVDSLDQKTAMHFRNLISNPTINAGQFEFLIPDGSDVIDMRQP